MKQSVGQLPEIDLTKKVSQEVPSHTRGEYAFVKALLPALGIFVVVELLAYGFVALIHQGGKTTVINPSLAGAALVIAGIMLSSLINSSNQRFNENHEALGSITNALRILVHEVKGNKKILLTAAQLTKSMYWFLNDVPVEVLDNGKKQGGAQPIAARLMRQVDEMSFTPAMHIELISRVRDIQNSLGGINRRRKYQILRSRYVVNGIFCATATFLFALSMASDKSIPSAIQIITFILIYGLSTAFIYVIHMAAGIGYDPGNARPDIYLNTWFDEIKAACENAELSQDQQPFI